jgi:hypothetical protein
MSSLTGIEKLRNRIKPNKGWTNDTLEACDGRKTSLVTELEPDVAQLSQLQETAAIAQSDQVPGASLPPKILIHPTAPVKPHHPQKHTRRYPIGGLIIWGSSARPQSTNSGSGEGVLRCARRMAESHAYPPSSLNEQKYQRHLGESHRC